MSVSLVSLLMSLAFAQEALPERTPHEPLEPSPPPVEPVGIEDLVGLPYEEVLQAGVATVSYEMSHRNANFSAPEISEPRRGWPVYALQWKDHASGNAHSFDASEVMDLQVYTTYFSGFSNEVSAGDEVYLNDLEATSTVFSSDPAGTWMYAHFPNKAEGFVFAALVMHYWHSPVFFESGALDAASSNYLWHVVMEELTFTIPSAANLHAACGLPTSAAPSVALSMVPTCNHGAILDSGVVTQWMQPLGSPVYLPNLTRTGGFLGTAYDTTWSGVNGELIFDPPAEATTEDLMGLFVLAEALAPQVLVADGSGLLVPLSELEGFDGE